MAAGIMLRRKVGDTVAAGDVLCTVYGNDKDKTAKAADEALKAYIIGAGSGENPELIKNIIR